MAKFLLAIYLILGVYKLAPYYGAPNAPKVLRETIYLADVKENAAESENSRTSQSDPETFVYFLSTLQLTETWQKILKSTTYPYLKVSAGFRSLAFAPPDII